MRAATRRYRSIVVDSRRWEGFRFRDDDIVISTPPKCGTTWMQMLCALLIFQTPDLPARLTELSPWLDIQTEVRDDVIASLDAQRHRRFIKTHTPLDGIPFDERVTYISVGRDPRDVAVSWDNHFQNMNLSVFLAARAAAVGIDDIEEVMPDGPPAPAADPRDRFWQWIDDEAASVGGLTGLSGTLHHLSTFWRVRAEPNVALFHYADLQADLEGEFQRLATVLGIEVDDAVLPVLVDAARFDSMRSRASQLAPQVKVEGFWNDDNRFFHVGGSGQWHQFMGPDDAERYEKRVQELAAPDLVGWVHAGKQALASA
ncbi:MAG: sulfotransferase domain-containing protein [Acidimicrobiia bacterium]|nr:sulfotransferase domain-containing protein [Acidimicrobiia bacterium]